MFWFIIILILTVISNVNTLVPIGANMDSLVEWSHSQPYVNLIKQSHPWGSPDTPWDGNATFDNMTGWPTCDFGVSLANGVDMGGEYLLYAKGNAEISIDLDGSAYISNKTYNEATNTLTAVLNIPQNSTFIMLSFRNTTGPGLQDIVILQPDYNLTSKLNFTNLMLAHLSRFSIIRFMDWVGTNGNSEVNWNDTTPVNWPQYRSPRHNPWQMIAYLANQINKPIDIWVNIPIGATDDYILNLARVMFNELNPTNKIYLEYSNEVWNYAFPQAHTNLGFANDSVMNHGDPYHFNYDNCSNIWYWAVRRTVYQITHIADIFKTIFGEQNVGQWKRVRPIYAGQVGDPHGIHLGLSYLNDVHGPPSNYLHGIAGAPYFSLGEFASWSNLTTDQVLDAFNLSIQTMLPEAGWGQNAFVGAHAVYAAWYNLTMYGYEGGPDTASGCGDCSFSGGPTAWHGVALATPKKCHTKYFGSGPPLCSFDAKVNATRHPRMTDICVTYLNGWYRFGFQELNWYGAGAEPISKWGSWSLLEDMRQETLIDTTHMFNSTSPVAQLPRPAPKLKAIDQVHQSSIEFNFGIPIPSSNINATNYTGHRVPYPDPDVRNIGVNETFYYPLKIVQSPIRINVTVYVSGYASILEGGINNGQFIQVQTPQTANWTTFEAVPVMQFNIPQTIVPSLVILRLKAIQKGFNIGSFDVVLAT